MLMTSYTNAQSQKICENYIDLAKNDFSEDDGYSPVQFVAARKGTSFQLKVCNTENKHEIGYIYLSSAYDGEEKEIYQVMYNSARWLLDECELND